jgi:hypothetical protein
MLLKILCFAGLVFMVGCNKPLATVDQVPSAVIAVDANQYVGKLDSSLNVREKRFVNDLLAKDVSAIVKASSSNLPGSQEALASAVPTALVKLTALTPGESRIVYGWRTPANAQCQFDETIASIGNYYTYFGNLPTSYAEVIAKSHGGHEIMDLTAVAPESVVNSFARAFNPITGRIYADFSNSQWSAGGLFIQPLTLEEVKSNYPGWIGNDKLPYPSAFHYKVFGEGKDSILAEDIMVSGQPPANDPNSPLESAGYKEFERKMEDLRNSGGPPPLTEHSH